MRKTKHRMMGGVHIDDGTKIQALTLLFDGKSRQEIAEATAISQSNLSRLKKKALERGYDPTAKFRPLLLQHVVDDPRPGRPKIILPELEEAVKKSATMEDRSASQKTLVALAAEFGISATAVGRILKPPKPSVKKIPRPPLPSSAPPAISQPFPALPCPPLASDTIPDLPLPFPLPSQPQRASNISLNS